MFYKYPTHNKYKNSAYWQNYFYKTKFLLEISPYTVPDDVVLACTDCITSSRLAPLEAKPKLALLQCLIKASTQADVWVGLCTLQELL